MALGSATFSNAGGAVSDLFGAMGQGAKAESYDLAAERSDAEAKFATLSGEIKDQQLTRNIYQTIGGQASDTAGAGLAMSGSATDLLRSSTQQGALAHATLTLQNDNTVTGYQDQAKSYRQMASAARTAEAGSFISSALKGAAAVASVLAAPATGGLSLAALPTLAGS